jgi:hypothetical protein
MKVSVHHWRYENGWRRVPCPREKLAWKEEFSPEIVGWHCWAYTDNDEEFIAMDGKEYEGQV